MHSKHTAASRAENEKQLLRFLCASGEAVTDRRKLFQRLGQYSWSDNDHQILFEAIGELLAAVPAQILNHLPATLTRRGFPDTCSDWLAAPSDLNTAAALRLAEDLLHASHNK